MNGLLEAFARIHTHPLPHGAGWADTLFRWIVHAAIWRAVGGLFRASPTVAWLCVALILIAVAWVLIRWIAGTALHVIVSLLRPRR